MSKKNKHKEPVKAPAEASAVEGAIKTEVVDLESLPAKARGSKYSEDIEKALTLEPGKGLELKGSKSAGNSVYVLLRKKGLTDKLAISRRDGRTFLVAK